MSRAWDPHCKTCDESLGLDWNHGEKEISAFIADDGPRKVSAIFKAGSAWPVECRFGPSDRDIARWCSVHAEHEVVARDEYGQLSTDCAAAFACTACGHGKRCRLLRGHAGEHAEKAAA